MGFLGYDEDNFIYTIPLVLLSLFIYGIQKGWYKLIGMPLDSTMSLILSSLMKIFLFWLYTMILAFYKCKRSGEEFDFKKSLYPTLVFVTYYTSMIILNLIPIFPFTLINTLVNNFIGMYIVAVLLWYPILKTTYGKCF